MSMYKSGSDDRPSIHKYAVFVEKYGIESSEATAYYQKFAQDADFAQQAEDLKQKMQQKHDEEK